jgi:hypothetical protein
MTISRRDLCAAGGRTAMIAVVGWATSSLAQSAASQTSPERRTTLDTLGANARQALIDIFREKDATAVDRYFGESFVQHDPNLADGVAGMKSFAAEAARSPAADITIYRTLVDGDFVLLHRRRWLATAHRERARGSALPGPQGRADREQAARLTSVTRVRYSIPRGEQCPTAYRRADSQSSRRLR